MKILCVSACIFFVAISFCSCSFRQHPSNIIPGIDRLNENECQTLLKGKRIGVVTNQTGINSDGDHLVDLLYSTSTSDFTFDKTSGTTSGKTSGKTPSKLQAIFSPEHGFFGSTEGGRAIEFNRHETYHCPVYSLYGENRKPTADMLDSIDVLVFDIQDVGARFYTYISTMYYAMEAAAENHVPFVILDRPDPVGGLIVEGPVLQREFESFVGIQPIPLRHGMTVGELAMLFRGEGWFSSSDSSELHIIRLKDWNRRVPKFQLTRNWINPSPNMPDLETAIVYPGMGLIEGTNMSEGRGTDHPFKCFGAPWLNHQKLCEEMTKLELIGISFDTVSFIPRDKPGVAVDPKYEGERCFGLQLTVTDYDRYEAVSFATHLICTVKKLHPEEFKWSSSDRIDRLAGTDSFRKAVDSGIDARAIIDMWQNDLVKFELIRKKYLLYN